MEDPEKSYSNDEASQLSRNRSFKSKQLVRSAAIRESASPPRTSPLPPQPGGGDVTAEVAVTPDVGDVSTVAAKSARDVAEPVGDVKKLVEIQIQGAWDTEPDEAGTEQRQRARRWLAGCTDLLSNNPRVACVCGGCDPCAHCRSTRRKQPSKQDSGISDECPDYSDTEQSGGSRSDSLRKSTSLDLEASEHHNFCRCSERREKPKNIQLCRTESDEKVDLSGVQLVNFIKTTLNKNPKDRAVMLRIEKELHALVNDDRRYIVRFPLMSSYHRMLVHRCASLFHLSHHLDSANKGCVLVSKTGTSGGRVPCTEFRQWCSDTLQQGSPTHAQHKSILKRDAHSLDESGASGGASASRSKSLEQREKEYLRVRRRIFSTDNCSQDDGQWPWNSGPVKLLTPDTGSRNKLLKVQSLEAPPSSQNWRSRPGVSKSHSFGGCGEAPQVRMLSRQGDLASSSWRLSPSSSGYKTLSMRSTDSVTPSPTSGVSPEPGASPQAQSGALLWAFTEMTCVPRGALIIHPQTGQPLSNPDGSLYRYDPDNPPLVYDDSNEASQLDQNNEGRRGRFEKQNSFVDTDCGCRQQDKCKTIDHCCECQRQDVDSKEVNEINSQEAEVTSPKRYDPVPIAPPAQPATANHAPPYDPPTNQRAEPTNHGAENGGYTQSYVQYREDVTSTPHPVVQQATASYIQTDLPPPPKATNIMQEHNLRQMPLQGIVYQPTIAPSGYAFTNHMSRMDSQVPHAMYQATPPDDVKHLSHDENTFRIDASYPYQPIEQYVNYPPQNVEHNSVQHRSYGVTYSQPMEQPVLPTYPISNVILPHHYPSQYQQLQWPLLQNQIPSNCATPLQKPTSPNIYLPETPYNQIYNQNQVFPIVQYPFYNYMPQMVPQQYYQPVYPVVERPNGVKYERRPCSVECPTPTNEKKPVPYMGQNRPDDKDKKRAFHRTNSVPNETPGEIAVKVQQINHQMASLNTDSEASAGESRTGPDGTKRRNNGSGILGNYPDSQHHQNNRVASRAVNDESQLSTAARAIVNSIRNMQAKNTHYHHDNRRNDHSHHHRHDSYHSYQNGRNRQHPRPDASKNESACQNSNGDQSEKAAPQPISDRGRLDVRHQRPPHPANSVSYRPPYNMLRQMSPGSWYRRSPGPLTPHMNNPRRPPPDPRSNRRQ